MPRKAREKSSSGIYHIMLRGINRQEIFHEEEDYKRFLETLARYKGANKIKVYGWCLMGNHVHLLIGKGNEEISSTLKRIGISYAWYHHWKYKHTGHLFQDRYRSENIDSDEYLLTVIRYIHQNPIKACLVKKCEDWRWSSCRSYYGEKEDPIGLTDKELILGMFSSDMSSSMIRFKEFNEQENDNQCLDEQITKRMTDEEAKCEIIRVTGEQDIFGIQSLPKEQRDKIINKVKGIEGLSQRQASRILGISPNLFFKAKF